MLQILLTPSNNSLELTCHLSIAWNNIQPENPTPKRLETAWWLVQVSAVSAVTVSILPLRAVSRILLATTISHSVECSLWLLVPSLVGTRLCRWCSVPLTSTRVLILPTSEG